MRPEPIAPAFIHSTRTVFEHHTRGPRDRPGGLDAMLEAVAAGDETAFGHLYDTLSPRLSARVRRVVRDPAQSEEVCQEVFLEIWQTAHRFDPSQGGAVGWMMTIARNKAVDRVRHTQATRRRDVGYLAANPERPSDSTADAAHQSLEAQRVRKALEVLTASQRRALELAYFGNNTHVQVAAILGLPLGTAKGRIRDGLAKLRSVLEPPLSPR